MTTAATTSYQQLFRSFGLRENPFRSFTDPRFLYLGRSYETVLAELMFGIESRGGLLVLTGEPGTGKTLLLRRLLQWLGQRNSSSAYIFHSHLNTAGLFGFIARDFGIAVESTKKTELLAAIQNWLQARQSEGDSPVIVIDEAQALSVRALSELCLLLNLENSSGKLVQIVLAGQSELDEKLHQPELRQLRQRITIRNRLPLLTLEETEQYIAARVESAGGRNLALFPAEAVQALYAYAHGTPRVINLLCEKALLAAYADRNPVVSVANVNRAASELDFGFAPVPESSAPHLAATSPRPSMVVPIESMNAVSEAPALPGMILPIQNEKQEQKAEAAPVTPGPPVMAPEPSSEIRTKPNVRVFTPKPAPVPALQEQPARNTANPVASAPVRQWRTSPSAFRRYWSDVVSSFVRDCKYFLSAFRTESASDGKVLFMKKYDLHRDLVAPVSRWLSKPVSFKGSGPSRTEHPERRTSHGH